MTPIERSNPTRDHRALTAIVAQYTRRRGRTGVALMAALSLGALAACGIADKLIANAQEVLGSVKR